ncbi:hypothetical protein M0805_003243 [Coniferiporia weirii]|nr:hypothetical protein M0805_003243 [Coniferiporia weirii]
MKGKREATKNDTELNTTQLPIKRIRQTELSTSSMTTDGQRTPLAELMATRVTNRFINSIKPNDTDNESLAHVLMHLFQSVYADPTWKDALDERYKDLQYCLAAIQANRHLAEECVKSMRSKDWEPVFALLGKGKVAPSISLPQDGVGLKSARFAWDINFVGRAHMILQRDMQFAANPNKPYSTITPIVQSSGMGKSRTVDELAKIIFTIPICYPYGDESLWRFFKRKISADEAQRMCINLLRSIMREISKNLQSEPISNEKGFAHGWYQRLKPPDGYKSSVRTKLYADACSNLPSSNDVEAARELVSEFKALSELIPSDETPPRAIIYIDECHYLSGIDISDGDKKRSLLDAMLHAIELCGKDGLFGITLSTNSSFRSVSPRADEFKSERELKARLPSNARPVPFTLLPFDCWKGTTIVNESESTLREVCTLEFSARFGRPLWWTRLTNPETRAVMLEELVDFAAQKLTLNRGGEPLSEEAKIAALSARLWLRLNTSLDSVRSLQDRLIESHMSLAYDVPHHKNYMYSGYSSEPILMEGAAHVWKDRNCYDFDPLETLKNAVTRGLLAKGERGELVGRYICLRAQDICVAKGGPDLIGDKHSHAKAVPLLSYFKAMFGPQWESIRSNKARNRVGGKTFEAACKGKYVRFTHFAKAGDASALTTAAAWKALARGNAWQFFDRQEGVDLGIPVFDGKPDDCLSRETVTWILIQIKNSSHLQAVHFSAESLGVFNDRMSKNQTPYFVLVFQLSVKALSKAVATTTYTNSSRADVPTSSRVLPTSPHKVEARQNEVYKTSGRRQSVDKRDPTRKAHPCYWVDVIGCSSKVFNSEIVPENNTVFRQLLVSRDLLDEARDDKKKAAILQLKPFFEAGQASYEWAGDGETGPTPGTVGCDDYEAETVNAVQEVEGEAYSDGEDDVFGS